VSTLRETKPTILQKELSDPFEKSEITFPVVVNPCEEASALSAPVEPEVSFSPEF